MDEQKNNADINQLHKCFKLPISYNDKKMSLSKNIINDLELVQTNDPSYNSMYSLFFNSNNQFSTKLTEQVSEYYTTDVTFLKDNQKLLKTYKKINKYTNDISTNYNKISEIWKEIKEDGGFKERYYYIDWSMWEFLNKSEQFLQFMSIYNLASPVISLFIPVIILIVPFFIIKMKGHNITMSQYIYVLKIVISGNAIGKLFTQFSSVTAQEKIYMIVSAAFYIFSIYQNILTCIRFNNNMKIIHSHLNDVKQYLNYTKY